MEIKENISLNDKNWFKTGGPARFFAEPGNIEEFQKALQYAKNNDLEVFVLGKGANILISDDGFDGLVIRPKIENIFHKIELDEVKVTAGAGVSVSSLIEYCLKNNIVGLEIFSGIPGTVGGATCMNIHYFQHALSDFLVEAEIINRETREIEKVDKNWFNFGYDKSKLMKKNYFLVSATFKLKKATDTETAYAKGSRTEIIRHRNTRYPTKNTCGCFFRNFSENEVKLKIAGTDKKMIYVAYYLDKIGIKGSLNVGDAIVSHQHANMIVNCGNATTEDIIAVARTMQERVRDAYGMIPTPECEIVGFKSFPLHK